MEREPVAVSVCCITYNQEAYIRKCLDSILAQKTDFRFELLINDDASTDATPDILREYAKAYPDIIRLTLQTENKYSQGVVILKDIVFPQASGTYLAFCEGDDFWVDDEKLQKQYDAMEREPTAAWCAHYVQCVDEQAMPMDGVTLPPAKTAFSAQTLLSCAETLEFLVRNGIQLTSYFIRRELFRGYYEQTPEFVRIAPVDDEVMVRYCAASGPMIFLPENMSCYRMKSAGSWTAENEANAPKMEQHYLAMVDTIRSFDDFTEHRYPNAIAMDLLDKEWKAASHGKHHRQMMQKKFSAYRAALPLRSRVKLLAQAILNR